MKVEDTVARWQAEEDAVRAWLDQKDARSRD